MGECRFEGKDWQGDEYTCRTHKGENPVLCSHAAADLERRLEAQATSIKTYQSVIARLEEERAQWPKNEFGSYLTIGEHEALKNRLAQAEAREAAMRRTAYVLAMEILQSDLYQHADEEMQTAIESATVRPAPDAGRAQEVK